MNSHVASRKTHHTLGTATWPVASDRRISSRSVSCTWILRSSGTAFSGQLLPRLIEGNSWCLYVVFVLFKAREIALSREDVKSRFDTWKMIGCSSCAAFFATRSHMQVIVDLSGWVRLGNTDWALLVYYQNRLFILFSSPSLLLCERKPGSYNAQHVWWLYTYT